MAKFNTKKTPAKTVTSHPDRIVNKAGGVAFDFSNAKEKLYNLVSCSLIGEDKYYQSGADHNSEIVKAIDAVSKQDPEFILKLATYIREELNLRSAPVFMLAEAAHLPETKPFVKEYTPKIIQRVDEITEVLQLYKSNHLGKSRKHTFPASLKKGLAATFSNFDEYQFAKYDRDGDMKLKDALRIVIGFLKETDEERRTLYKKILEGNLETPMTWETEISGKGSTTENWQKILDSGKMGIFAVVRNLRNMITHNVKLDTAIKMLTDPKTIEQSKMFPFRFYQAWNAIDGKGATEVKDALADAIAIAADKNIPKMDGTTLISVDVSGSMDSKLSEKSEMSYKEIGTLFGAMAHKFCDKSIISAFGDSFATVELSKRDSIITNMHKIAELPVGWSTNAYKVMDYLLDNKLKVDRVIFFTDMQVYNTNSVYARDTVAAKLVEYRRKHNQNLKAYIFDLAGYGEAMIPTDDPQTAIINGWSDKIFKFIELFEGDKKTAIKYIEENY